jgi:hypothetical protein
MRRRALLLVVAATALASCRSAFTNVWEDPDWKGAPLRNVLVIGKEVDAATRRAYEDAMTERLVAIGIQAEPSYRTVPDEQLTPDAIARTIALGGQDGLITARLIDVDERMQHLPGVRRSSMGRWRSWHGFDDPGTWRIDRVARIETQVWTLAADDESSMIWAGSSERVNPRDIPSLARSLAQQTVSALQSVGILPAE